MALQSVVVLVTTLLEPVTGKVLAVQVVSGVQVETGSNWEVTVIGAGAAVAGQSGQGVTVPMAED